MNFPAPPLISSYSTARVLVLTCIDPRFTAFTGMFLTHVKQVHSSYDLFALAGSTLGVTQARFEAPLTPVYENWDTVFFDHVKLAVVLHGITEIWLFDHLGCAAYEQFLLDGVDDTLAAPHTTQMNLLKDYVENYENSELELQNTIRNLKISGFLLDFDGSVRVLLGSPKINVVAYNKQTYYWASGAIIVATTALLIWLAYYVKNKNKFF
jgi:hypothetical protein